MTPAEAARVTAALSHIGGLLDTLPLQEYLEHLRTQRAALPSPWLEHSAVEDANRRRLQALISAGTKAADLVDEVHAASAFWHKARALESQPPRVSRPEEYEDFANPGGSVLRLRRPERVARDLEAKCKCPMGECTHRVGFDGPA